MRNVKCKSDVIFKLFFVLALLGLTLNCGGGGGGSDTISTAGPVGSSSYTGTYTGTFSETIRQGTESYASTGTVSLDIDANGTITNYIPFGSSNPGTCTQSNTRPQIRNDTIEHDVYGTCVIDGLPCNFSGKDTGSINGTTLYFRSHLVIECSDPNNPEIKRFYDIYVDTEINAVKS